MMSGLGRETVSFATNLSCKKRYIMDFSISADQSALRDGVASVMKRFDADYWLARDDDGEFPFEYHRAMAEGGWLGITMPEAYGGSGLGVTEAAIMMHEVASHGGGMAAASSVHINLRRPGRGQERRQSSNWCAFLCMAGSSPIARSSSHLV